MQTYSNTANNFSAHSLGQYIPSAPAAGEDLSVSPTDTIYVSAVQFGKTLLDRVTLTGCRSVGDILRAVSSLLGQTEGIVTVSFRNRDNGWRASRSLRLRRPSMSMLATA